MVRQERGLVLTSSSFRASARRREDGGIIKIGYNLRLAADSQNKANVPPRGKSGIKGVRFYKGAWEANICKGRKHQYLGRFSSAKAAADAYDQAATRTHGEFAWLNNLET